MTDPTKPTATSNRGFAVPRLMRFSGGSALGAFLVAIPFWFSDMPIQDVTGVQMGIGAIAMLGCGVLGLTLGEKFFDGVMKTLEGMGT